MIVNAHQGDTIDSLCWRHLGSSAQVETVFALNPGIAAIGPILPIGQAVTLPDIADSDNAAPRSSLVQLWD